MFNSGTTGGTSWKGRLIGVADYKNNPDNHHFILKLETGNDSDWFLGFNRKTGINSDNVMASNRVVIYNVHSGDGKSYSQSYLKGTISAGRKATISNWRKSGMDLDIIVKAINTSASPGYAEVEVQFGPQNVKPQSSGGDSGGNGGISGALNDLFGSARGVTPNPTRKPSKQPTKRPTPVPTKKPTLKPTAKPVQAVQRVRNE